MFLISLENGGACLSVPDPTFRYGAVARCVAGLGQPLGPLGGGMVRCSKKGLGILAAGACCNSLIDSGFPVLGRAVLDGGRCWGPHPPLKAHRRPGAGRSYWARENWEGVRGRAPISGRPPVWACERRSQVGVRP